MLRVSTPIQTAPVQPYLRKNWNALSKPSTNVSGVMRTLRFAKVINPSVFHSYSLSPRLFTVDKLKSLKIFVIAASVSSFTKEVSIVFARSVTDTF